ncbi:MAG: hypothetical protein ACHQF2_08795 [Flavobacteriales bacterium]
MAREIKCPSCNQWNTASGDSCTFCGSILDSNAFVQNIRAIESLPAKPLAPKKPTWLDKFLEKTKASKNPFVIVARTVLYYTWMVYFAIVLFFTWITVYTAG